MRVGNFLLVAMAISLLGVVESAADGATPNSSDVAKRPNIVLIMGDDIGYSDLGCYGSEIATPNLDRLATEGLRFRTFYNMAKCQPSRSSLLTGRYGGAEEAIHSLPRRLGDAGYFTAMSGKEHLERWATESSQARDAFARSFIVGGDFFVPLTGKTRFRLDGRMLAGEEIALRGETSYKTDVLTNYAISFLEESRTAGKPFFLYLPHNAAHYPLQALPEDIARYRGKYMSGWDAVRAARFEKMKANGLVPEEWTLSPPSGNINRFRKATGTDRPEIRELIPLYRPWVELSAAEQEALDLEMAVYAAMIDRMDQNIGRVLAKIEEIGELENTIVIYLSDNGACPYDSNQTLDLPPGGPGSFRSLCAAWANVGNTPYRYFKQYGHEGGCNTHCIVWWPGRVAPGIADQPGHIVDILPTLMEAAGVAVQGGAGADGKRYAAVHGQSLMPILEGRKRPEPEFFISGHTERFRMFRQGNWKIVKTNDEQWELYYLADDPTELRDLAGEDADRLEKMVAEYQSLRPRLGMRDAGGRNEGED